jgi:hypothetical protein
MSKQSRSRLFAGVLLILLGIWFLMVQLVPGLGDWMQFTLTWPWIIIGVGIFLLFMGLLVGEPGMAVPACVVGGIGCLLLYQNTSGNWESWAYAWTLIPGFVGVGVLLSGILDGHFRSALSSGGSLLMISLILFLIFGSFFGLPLLGDYWPVLLILLGFWLLFKTIFLRKA